jgi:hypothetical protein
MSSAYIKLANGSGSMRVKLRDILDVKPFAPSAIAAKPAPTGATIILKDGSMIDTESSIAGLLKHIQIIRRKK